MFNKLFTGAFTIGIVSFLLPASQLVIGGQTYRQYPLTGYSGLVAFAILLLVAGIEGFYFYKNKRWLPWGALVTGVYLASYTVFQLVHTVGLFAGEPAQNLAGKLQAQSSAMPGIFLLAFASLSLIGLSIIDISRCIAAKN